jgi:hypothetical protein
MPTKWNLSNSPWTQRCDVTTIALFYIFCKKRFIQKLLPLWSLYEVSHTNLHSFITYHPQPGSQYNFSFAQPPCCSEFYSKYHTLKKAVYLSKTFSVHNYIPRWCCHFHLRSLKCRHVGNADSWKLRSTLFKLNQTSLPGWNCTTHV